MRGKSWLGAALAVAVLSATLGCASTPTSQSTGEYIDDSAITTKVKAELLGDSGLSSFDIGVETQNRVVQLSGFVDSQAVKARAGQIAAGVAGVRSVRNDLVVK
ncbi:BON domain-containing protein [Elioraea rosea]|uniref:BON domain-containing protein n=1 Tax=Elioraea rosea TaxID=2492390 RepID=UPI001183406C|nr:BON domain-containing protein [Elioraea rosea]